MKQIVFLRHGQAGTAATDAEKRLTPLGIKQAEASAHRLKQAGFIPGIIISSPYARAMQTAEIARKVILDHKMVKITTEPAIAIQDSDSVIAAIYAALAEHDSLLLTGHVPLFEEIPYQLCGIAPRMKTGSFAWIEAEEIIPGRKISFRLKENFIPEVQTF